MEWCSGKDADGQAASLSRIIYAIVGIAGLWCISLLFRERTPVEGRE